MASLTGIGHGKREGNYPYNGLLQPETNESGEGVVHHQQKDWIGVVIPMQILIFDDHPSVRAVCLSKRSDAEQPVNIKNQSSHFRG